MLFNQMLGRVGGWGGGPIRGIVQVAKDQRRNVKWGNMLVGGGGVQGQKDLGGKAGWVGGGGGGKRPGGKGVIAGPHLIVGDTCSCAYQWSLTLLSHRSVLFIGVFDRSIVLLECPEKETVS